MTLNSVGVNQGCRVKTIVHRSHYSGSVEGCTALFIAGYLEFHFHALYQAQQWLRISTLCSRNKAK